MLSGFSGVQLSGTLWTIAHQVLLSMGLSRQEYSSGLPFLSQGDLPDPESEPSSPALAGRFFPTVPPGTPSIYNITSHIILYQFHPQSSKGANHFTLEDPKTQRGLQPAQGHNAHVGFETKFSLLS